MCHIHQHGTFPWTASERHLPKNWLSRRSVWGFKKNIKSSRCYSSIPNPKCGHSYESYESPNIIPYIRCSINDAYFSSFKSRISKNLHCIFTFHLRPTLSTFVTKIGRSDFRTNKKTTTSPGAYCLPATVLVRPDGWNGKDQLWTTNTMGAKEKWNLFFLVWKKSIFFGCSVIVFFFSVVCVV